MCHKSLRRRNLWQSIVILQKFSPLHTMMLNTSLRRVSPILFRQCCSRHKSFPTVYLSSMSIFSKRKEQNHTIVTTNSFHPLLLNKKFSMSPTFFSTEKPKEEEKVSIFQKFKKMSKDYWYVLVPVHVATSLVWFGGFYMMCKSGIDVAALLQTFGVSEAYVEKLSNSEMGYYALSYACYKIATPARYTVTVGGTTLTIAKLKDTGYLKSTSEFAGKMKDKSDDMKEKYRYEERKDKMEGTLEDLKEKAAEKKDQLKDNVGDAWEKMKDRTDDIKDKAVDKKDQIKDNVEVAW